MRRAWAVPLGAQLDLLVRWLEPILDRPGLTREPELRIVVVDAEDDAAQIELEPFDALVGPVRVADEGIVADVIPVEPFIELRRQAGATGEFTPRVVLARTDGSHTYEPIEAVASEAIYVDALELVDVP
ncbi:MAG TPA: hypothetical protein VFI01_00070 [Gaiellaceae bacterium]|nr:hypothetical protein [Gaiellaceae bacterium]